MSLAREGGSRVRGMPLRELAKGVLFVLRIEKKEADAPLLFIMKSN
jgi:hypothetical protein